MRLGKQELFGEGKGEKENDGVALQYPRLDCVDCCGIGGSLEGRRAGMTDNDEN